MIEIKKIDDLKALMDNNISASFELQTAVIFGETCLFARRIKPKIVVNTVVRSDARCQKCDRRDEACYCTN